MKSITVGVVRSMNSMKPFDIGVPLTPAMPLGRLKVLPILDLQIDARKTSCQGRAESATGHPRLQ